MLFGGKHTLGYLFMKALKFNKKLMTSAFLKRSEVLTILVAFAAQNLIVSFRDLAIFRLKCNEQHSSIPKSQKPSLAKFS